MVMRLPKKPVSNNLDEHHRVIGDIINFLVAINQNGLGVKGFSQQEINTMTKPEQAGKFVFNETTGKINHSEINTTTKVITWKEL